MAPATRTRRPLPRRVYWFRRLLLLGVVGGVAAALVLGIGRLLDYSTDDSGGEQAAPVASSPDPSPEGEATTGERRRKSDRGGARRDEERDELAKPEGPCEDGDVLVTPTIDEAYAGSPVKIVLELTTVEADACYWEVSPESVFVNIDGAEGTIWSSQQCPDAVPVESVVPRRERPAKVAMWWDGKESDDGCSAWRAWVDVQGSYTAVAAARGSVTPVSTGFFLGPAVAATVTRTPTPSPTPTKTRSGDAGSEKTPDHVQSSKPSSSPRPSASSDSRPGN